MSLCTLDAHSLLHDDKDQHIFLKKAGDVRSADEVLTAPVNEKSSAPTHLLLCHIVASAAAKVWSQFLQLNVLRCNDGVVPSCSYMKG